MGDAWSGQVERKMRQDAMRLGEEQRRSELEGEWVCWNGSGARVVVTADTPERAARLAMTEMNYRESDTFWIYPLSCEATFDVSFKINAL